MNRSISQLLHIFVRGSIPTRRMLWLSLCLLKLLPSFGQDSVRLENKAKEAVTLDNVIITGKSKTQRSAYRECH